MTPLYVICNTHYMSLCNGFCCLSQVSRDNADQRLRQSFLMDDDDDDGDDGDAGADHIAEEHDDSSTDTDETGGDEPATSFKNM